MFPKSITSFIKTKNSEGKREKNKKENEKPSLTSKIKKVAEKAKNQIDALSPRNIQRETTNPEIENIADKFFDVEAKERDNKCYNFSNMGRNDPEDLLLEINRSVWKDPLYEVPVAECDSEDLEDDSMAMRKSASEVLTALHARRTHLLENFYGNMDQIRLSGNQLDYYFGIDSIVKGTATEHQALKTIVSEAMRKAIGCAEVPLRDALLYIERAIGNVQREAGSIADVRTASRMNIQNAICEARNRVAKQLASEDFTPYQFGNKNGGLGAAISSDLRIILRVLKKLTGNIPSQLSEAGYSETEYRKVYAGLVKEFTEASSRAIKNDSFVAYRDALIHLHCNLGLYALGQPN